MRRLLLVGVALAPLVAAAQTPSPLIAYDAAGSRLSTGTVRAAGLAAPAASVQSTSDAYAYPVPFRPHGPQSGTGPGRTGTDAEGITFVQLPPQGTIDIYTTKGEKVWHGAFGDGSGLFSWDTRSSSGQPAAGGIYLYVIIGPQDKKIGKLAIVR